MNLDSWKEPLCHFQSMNRQAEPIINNPAIDELSVVQGRARFVVPTYMPHLNENAILVILTLVWPS